MTEFGHSWKEGDDKIGEITPPQSVDMVKLELAARQRFLPHVDKASRDFSLIERNLEYTYKRRNMRQTFVIGLLIAFVMSFPIQHIYDRATALTDEQAVAMVDQVLAIYESQQAAEEAAEGGETQAAERDIKDMNALVDVLTRRLSTAALDEPKRTTDATDLESPADSATVAKDTERSDMIPAPILTAAFWDKKPIEWLCYILGCILTAVLLSFGAPFWNDIAKSVLNYKKSMVRTPAQAAANSERGTS